jgi:hypothetical protein
LTPVPCTISTISTVSTLEKRINDSHAQKSLAASTEFPAGE